MHKLVEVAPPDWSFGEFGQVVGERSQIPAAESPHRVVVEPCGLSMLAVNTRLLTGGKFTYSIILAAGALVNPVIVGGVSRRRRMTPRRIGLWRDLPQQGGVYHRRNQPKITCAPRPPVLE